MNGYRKLFLLVAIAGMPHLAPPPAHAQSMTELQAQVREAETGFARSMADRDHEAFASFLADDAIFFGDQMLRGKESVAAGWAPFFEGPDAPFSWAPEAVEVVESGTLAHSSGPVRDPAGNIVGYFNSIWRLEADGSWRVVFDKGCSGP
jgi:ketosteroid isomerase-like protein